MSDATENTIYRFYDEYCCRYIFLKLPECDRDSYFFVGPYYVGRTITLVHYDLTADLSLKSISAQLNVNPNYFATLFRKECGCTLTEYVNGQRIDRAFALLKKTGKPVQEIASECGFSDANYFIRLFKRRTGLTPNQYRQQQQ